MLFHLHRDHLDASLWNTNYSAMHEQGLVQDHREEHAKGGNTLSTTSNLLRWEAVANEFF